MVNWSYYGIESNSQVTDEVIREVELKLGVSFPSAYLDLVKYNDEAVFEVGTFEYDGGTTCISEFLKFGNTDEQYSILWCNQSNRLDLPDRLVAIARDAGDFLVCLDFGGPDVSVKLYDPNKRLAFSVAENFSKFISGLRE